MIVTPPSRERLLQLAQQLPASSQILMQLNELLLDINSGLEDIAKLLKRDSTLAARIIRISNSVAYGTMGGIASIEDAVSRVGFAEAYRLTGFAAAAQLADRPLTYYGHSGERLRDNTLVSALAAESLARRAGVDPRVMYTAALMRSTGKLVLDRYAKTILTPSDSYDRAGVAMLLGWETNVFGRTNAEVGALILESWHFPPAIVEPVKLHYLLQAPTGVQKRAATLLNIAAGIACDCGYSLPGESNYWELSSEKIQTAGLIASHIGECAEEAQELFELIRGSL